MWVGKGEDAIEKRSEEMEQEEKKWRRKRRNSRGSMTEEWILEKKRGKEEYETGELEYWWNKSSYSLPLFVPFILYSLYSFKTEQ